MFTAGTYFVDFPREISLMTVWCAKLSQPVHECTYDTLLDENIRM